MKLMKNIIKYSVRCFLILTILVASGLLGLSPKTEPQAITAVDTLPVAVAKYQDFHLLIPALDISAPVISDVDGTNKKTYFKALEDGVAHFKNTAKPGGGSNIFIFGHSSYYNWAPGDYKKIFSNLEEIKIGDEIDLWWQEKEYQYVVAATKVVPPSDTSVLEPTPTEQLTLMTCVPVGTDKNRLIVIAKPK